VIAMALALPAGAALAVPEAVPYIGYLQHDQTSEDGKDNPTPFSGFLEQLSVSVFDQEEGGELVWGPCLFAPVPVDNGVFVVLLDAAACGENFKPLPAAGAWLDFTITMGEESTLLQGRQAFLSLPYALWAENTQTCEEAQTVTGVNFENFVTVDQEGNVVITGDQEVEGTVTATEVVVGTGAEAVNLADLVIQVQAMQKTIDDQAKTIADLQSDDCPAGYLKVADANIPATGFYCRKPVGGGKYDEMVKVGDYWTDRYEASVWENKDCTGGPKTGPNGTVENYGASDNWASSGATGADGDNGFFPRNGNWTTKLYACSIAGVTPSRWLSWFQAEAACQLSGKHLCTNGEWQGAAEGTPDPGAWPDDEAGGCTGGQSSDVCPSCRKCNTCSSGPRPTGTTNAWSGDFATSCMSQWGAFDMVGNLWEWADLWGQAGPDKETGQGAPATPWPTGYGGDGTWNINGEAFDGGGWKTGIPAAAFRGGAWAHGPEAGVFALDLSHGPSLWYNAHGARCCRRK
jgi:formylglycine-generating enzyme required for sulfatase activity